jgi:hypothetical protein
MTKVNDVQPTIPRSFGDIPPGERLGPVVGEGDTPWGKAKEVQPVYAVVDHWYNGRITVARFHDVNQAVELFKTAEMHVGMGVMKGSQLISAEGEVVDQVGVLNKWENNRG